MRKREGAANSTVNHETGAIGQAFSLAIEDETISVAPKIPQKLSEKESVREVRYSLEQADAVAAEFQKRGELDAFDFWTWMRVSGGMRPKAITALEWPSLEREGDRWTLRLPAADDKSGYGRPIPLEGETREGGGKQGDPAFPGFFTIGDANSPWTSSGSSSYTRSFGILDFRRGEKKGSFSMTSSGRECARFGRPECQRIGRCGSRATRRQRPTGATPTAMRTTFARSFGRWTPTAPECGACPLGNLGHFRA